MTHVLCARLHHLQFASPTPARLAGFYADALDMTVTRDGRSWICRGPKRCLVFVEGEAKTLVSAGYAIHDREVLENLCTRLASRQISIEKTPTALFPEHSVTFRDPDGHQVSYGIACEDAVSSNHMPARLQHLVVGSTNAERMVEFYTNVIGLRESDRVDDDSERLRTSFMRTDDEHHSFAVFQTSENRLDHHCYEVEDWNGIRDCGDRFAGMRIPIKWGPGRHGPGNNLFMFIHDPDGNWVELSAELQIIPTDKPTGRWRHEEHTLNSWGQAFLRS
jgi:catechol 2,3-dioxygenase